MLEQIKDMQNKKEITFIAGIENSEINSLKDKMNNVILVNNNKESKEVINIINKSKIKKIYLVGYSSFYDYLLPRIKKEIEVCWIYVGSFSDLSDENKRIGLHYIFEYIDRDFVNSIGCTNSDNVIVFENAGYKCEYIDLKPSVKFSKYKLSNSIGIISNDFDPKHNYYNQLAALTLLDYDYCKVKYNLKVTKDFIDFFNLKVKKVDSFDELIKDNFVNLYINFTNSDDSLIIKSFSMGIPCIIGNTNIFNKNKFLQEHLVIKSDDDVNEIAEKISFVKNNREKIIEEYKKMI